MAVPTGLALDLRLRAAGVPIAGVEDPGGGLPFVVRYGPSATPSQRTQGDALAAGSPPGRRAPRPASALIADLTALAPAQQIAVWNDFSANAGAKILANTGANAWTLLGMYAVLQGLAVTANQKFTAVAMYCADVPGYLVNPAFDPAINVPGDAPAP